MRKEITFFLFCCLIIPNGHLFAANLVSVYNGSFEISAADHSGLPDGWKLLAGGPMKLDATVAHEGKKSLVLTSAGSKQEIMTNTTFPFEPHQSLQISIWSQSAIKRGKASLIVYWFDQSIRNTGAQVLELSGQVQPWTENTFLLTPPASAARLAFHIELNGNGTVWFDELKVTQMAKKSVSKPRRSRTSQKPIYMPVDISKNVNMAFIDDRNGDGKGGWTDQGDNDLRNFPRGRQTFGGVPFDILDPEARGHKAVIMLGKNRSFPNETVISPVPRRFDVLHILHAAAWINNGRTGQYTLRYADNTEASVDILANRHLADWWYPVDLPDAPVAWYGNNRIRDLIGVWQFSWINPHPEKDVKAIILKSTGVVIGICGLTTQQGGPLPTGRKASSIQITLAPESIVLDQGRPLKIRAAVYHGQTQPAKIHCLIALYRGVENDSPLLSRVYQLSLAPKQVGEINYSLDKLDLPAGSYHLVCHAETPEEKQTASIPVGILPPAKNEKFSGYGMMYVGPPLLEDFRRIKQAGFDWISLDIQWRDVEPVRGKYDWTLIDQFIATAKQAEIKVEIKTLLFLGIPWLDQKNNYLLVPSNFSEEFMTAYCRLWQTIMDRYKDEPTIFAWCPTIGHQDNPVMGIEDDRSPALHAAWRKYLQQAGWTLEKVSAVLGKKISVWDELNAPDTKYVNTAGPNDYFMAFMKMRKEKAVENYSRLCEIIRRRDPARPIILKMGQPWPVDVYDAPNGLWPSGWMKMCKKYNATLLHSNFEDTTVAAILPAMAEHYGVSMIIEEGKTPPSPPTTIASVGHGARYDTRGMEFCYWPAGKNLSTWSKIKPVVYRMLEFTRSYDNLWVASLQDNIFANAQNWPNMQRYYVKAYDLLTKLGCQYHVVDADNLEKVPADAVLFDPNCFRLDNTSRDRIDALVRSGVTFVGQFLTDSEAGYALYARWGITMKKHVGGTITFPGTQLSYEAADGFSPTGSKLETILAWPDGRPAAVRKKIGKGYILVLGCGYESDVASSAAVLQALLKQMGVRRQVTLTPYGAAEIAVKKQNGRLQLALINRDPMPKDLVVVWPEISLENYTAFDWLNGREIQDLHSRLRCKLNPCEIRLFEFTPTNK